MKNEVVSYNERKKCNRTFLGEYSMKKWNLKNNLLYIREARKETMDDLAQAIGVSKSTIHNYENQKDDKARAGILKRIAIRYGVTVDELCYGDFSYLQGVKLNTIQIEDHDRNKEISRLFYPIFKPSKKAFDDPFFVKGYEAQNKIIDYFYNNGTKFNGELLIQCVNSYAESIEKNHTLESSANLLWLYIFASTMVKNKNLYYGLYELYDQQIEKDFFFKEYVYKSFEKNENNEYEEYTLGDGIEFEIDEVKILEEILEVDEDDYATLFYNLKRNYQGCAYADYFMAFRYAQNLIKNDFNEETNVMLGMELMENFARMDNEYAINFFKAMENFYSIE